MKLLSVLFHHIFKFKYLKKIIFKKVILHIKTVSNLLDPSWGGGVNSNFFQTR